MNFVVNSIQTRPHPACFYFTISSILVFTSTRHLPDNPDPPPPRPPLPLIRFFPILSTCTMTGFLDSYLADLDPAFSKFHIYINNWPAFTRPSPTPAFYFKFYTYFNSWVTYPPPFYHLFRVKYAMFFVYNLLF